MSKAFTKDEPGEDPVIVPERAPLPPGVPNYVTERGKSLLEEEHRQLLAQRAQLKAEPDGERDEARQKQLAILNRRLADLSERIATARVVQPPDSPDKVVRFGATVTLKTREGAAAGEVRRITLVGVDEAGERADLVSFSAPIARAVLGHRPGDAVTHRRQAGEEVLEIVDVVYGEGR